MTVRKDNSSRLSYLNWKHLRTVLKQENHGTCIPFTWSSCMPGSQLEWIMLKLAEEGCWKDPDDTVSLLWL